jgi:hypothetical protein
MQGDSDGDRDVDGSDLLVWQRELGAGPPMQPIPEPSTMAQLALVAFGALRYKARWLTRLRAGSAANCV